MDSRHRLNAGPYKMFNQTGKRNLLQQLYQDYQQQPDAPLNLPSITEEQLDLLDQIKQTLNRSSHQAQSEKVKIWHGLAWKIAYQTEDDDQIAQAHWCSAIFYNTHDILESLEHQQKAVAHFKKTGQRELEGRALIGCVHQMSRLGWLDEAEKDIKRCIDCLHDVPYYRDWPMVYINQSLLYISMGYHSRAVDATYAAEKKAIELADHDPQKRAHYDSYRIQALINRGLAEIILKAQTNIASEWLQQALELCQHYPDEPSTPYLMGLVCLNLARISTLRVELFEALGHLQDARDSFEQAEVGTMQAIVQLHAAEIYQRLMMPQHAVNMAKEAATSFTNARLATDAVEAYLIVVETILQQGRRKSNAQKYLTSAKPLLGSISPYLESLWTVYNAHPRLQTEEQYAHSLQQIEPVIEMLPQVASLQHTLKARLVAAELASHLGQSDIDSRYKAIATEAKEQGLAHLELSAYMGLADEQSGEKAIQTLRQAADILARSRQAMPVEELKANLLTGQIDIYVKLIEALLQSQNKSIATQTLLEAKGAIWHDLLLKEGRSEPVPEWVQARNELSYWQEQRLLLGLNNDPNDPSSFEFYKQKIEEAEAELENVGRTRYLAHQQSNAAPLPNLAKIQSHIDPKSIMLDYLVGSEHVYVCLISSDQEPEWLKLGQVGQIKDRMNSFSRQLNGLLSIKDTQRRYQSAQNQITLVQEILAELYELLIEPVHSWLNEQNLTVEMLHIAPDQWLYSVPWSALFDGQAYLGQQYPIALYPSAYLFALNMENAELQPTEQTDNIVDPKTVLLLGHPGHDPKNQLHYIEDELTQLQQIIPEAEVFPRATRDHYRHIQKPTCIHIAAHGHFKSKTPLLSGLEMEDGHFLLADVFKLDLHGTELVIPSACETGVAPERGGVVLALSGAFLCSGAKSVIASQWKVDDEATPKLMTSFYRAWRAGYTIAHALQQAQADVRAYHEHPFYWAAFQPLSRCK